MVAQVGGWDHNDTNVFNRELSWLAFNARVLQLSSDTEVPLLEQIRFLAIFSSNLDEFFQVRVSGLRDQQAAGISTPASDGRLPAEQLALVRDIVTDLVAEQERVLVHEIMPALREQGIELSAWHDLDDDDQAGLSERFRDRIFPVLTPLAVDLGQPFPYVSDLSLNLAVVVRDPRDERELFARVKVPNTLPRWLRIGDTDRFVPLEEVIAAHLDQLFPGMEVQEHHAFRVTRNADLSDALDEADDLLSAVEYELRRRRFGRATRLEVDASMTDEVLDLLIGEFDLDPSAVYVARTPLDPTSFNEIADIERPALRWPEWKGVVDTRLQPDDEPVNIFAEIRAGDVLVEHPYESFSRSVVEFIHQAANDPDVLAIKITLYRTASSSPIVDACIKAAEQGKQVVVLVELKARFDEAANIGWARRLEQAGVHVAYGLLGLKIHTKIAMAVREEPDGIRRYCHIGTGNYNHRTARIYEDIGILTADPEIGADVADLFNHLTGYGREIRYSKLLVAPDQLRPGLEALIDNEIASGRGRMILKMNGLVDVRMAEKLYEASQVGVDIDLIIRGQCSLKPGIPGLSDRIRVRSIIGRYLEHSRIYHFANGNGRGEPATYIGSADLMSRNLNRRVEALVRLDDPRTQQRVREILDVLLKDDRLAWTLAGDGVWTKRRGPAAIDTHARLQQLARGRANG
ncbi:MAG TPA: polyphosphate kinase 1 [Acidimicrobiaceae bacterium]|nr:polyphosphate kinase 1 [Acidimicrobiaceae bacterium]